MEPTIYFVKESPDFNFMLERGRMGRIAANRVVICVMTEFGLCNDRRMNTGEFSRFIESTQMATGKFDEKKDVFKKKSYIKRRYIAEPIKPVTLVESIPCEASVEDIV